ncbi:hypothetical protein A0J61_10844, partial [Choanephora cucurbitarum]
MTDQPSNEQVKYFENEILMTELKKLEYDIDSSSIPVEVLLQEAIELKYKKINEFMQVSSIDSVQKLKQQLKTDKQTLMEKRLIVEGKVKKYIRTVLQTLDIIWSIIEQFKYKDQKCRNIAFDEYYTSLVDTMLVK